MPTPNKRREFFKSFASLSGQKTKLLRPPYFCDAGAFLELCQNCDAPCVNACEEGIIHLENKTPVIGFENSGCTYCDACAEVCEKGVLEVEYKSKIDTTFYIDTKACLAWNDTVCSTCRDVCDEKAIDFFGMFRPTINESCTSCGFCLSPCPVSAIKER